LDLGNPAAVHGRADLWRVIVKYSKISGVVGWSGGSTLLREGQSIDEDHPLLKERPELFRGGEEVADLATRSNPGTVETAANTGPGGAARVRRS
jgi:hypothetical protein